MFVGSLGTILISISISATHLGRSFPTLSEKIRQSGAEATVIAP
jgi:hypothetical protein